MDVEKFLRDQYQAVAGVGAAILVVVVILIVVIIGLCCYCCRRRRRRRGYFVIGSSSYVSGRGVDVPISSLRSQHGEESIHDAMHRQRMEQEQSKRALLNCQFYIRSNANSRYVLESQLPDIGSRVSKNWFLLRPIDSSRSTNPLLLCMLPISQHCRINIDSAGKQVLNKLFKALNHPCIHSIVNIDYLPNKNLVAILEQFSQKGSLKDLIYQTTPALGWSTKYSVRRSSLKVSQIQNYGRQILEAISFLHDIGISPIGQVQSGNIYVEGGKCRVSGFENTLLGYRPRIHRLVKEYKENIDSAMFGHLLYEIGSGRELTVGCPTENDLASVRHPPVADILKFIFHNENDQLPNISEILELSFFQQVKTTDLDRWNLSLDKFQLTEEFKELIQEAKRPRVRTNPRRSQPTVNVPMYPVFTPTSPGRTGVTTSLPSVQSTASDKPRPPMAQEPEPLPPRSTKERGALLDDIHKGTKLKATVTNDRSAPMIAL